MSIDLSAGARAPSPARTTVAFAALLSGALVEIEVLAAGGATT